MLPGILKPIIVYVPIIYHNLCYPDNVTSLRCRNCSPVPELNFHNPTDDSWDPLINIDPECNLSSFRPSSCQYFDVKTFNDHFQALPSDKLSLIHINSRSLQSNFNSLYSQMHGLDLSFDLIGITETWLKRDSCSGLFSIPGYNFVHTPRSIRIGGGVGIYVKNTLKFEILSELSIFEEGVFESIFIQVKNSCTLGNYIVGVIYCPIGVDNDVSQHSFINILSKVSNANCKCYLMGDFDCNLLNLNSDSNVKDFLNLMISHSFYPLHSLPTHITLSSTSLVDNIFTNDPRDFHSGILIMDISDHLPVFSISKVLAHIDHGPPKPSKTRSFKSSQIDAFSTSLTNEDWHDVFHCNDPKRAYDYFVDKFLLHYNNSFPLVINREVSTHRKDWMTDGILNSRKTKNKLYRKYLKHPTHQNYKEYASFRNIRDSYYKKSKETFLLQRMFEIRRKHERNSEFY
ncbi:hypothetical protein HOLleu_41089 [Holothuria leucospilota]|uniref:Endonuclease/exonuclease/phosphatase domain-containing protein n=1 Tax=Holothuria leucospilota TaxID=206669 RepID=A0A9Q1BBV6_HOLLE|nr:hypothetical protein HOLleu_41089 [Holothuria leucospilota]